MKRRAVKLVVFLLAGAIINVAVAWGLALRRPVSLQNPSIHGFHQLTPAGLKLHFESADGFGSSAYRIHRNLFPQNQDWGLSANAFASMAKLYKDEHHLPQYVLSRL